MKNLLLCAALLAAPILSLAMEPPAAAASAADAMTDAEVRKVDLAAAKVTLRHAEIKSLDMPAMTMVFQARDKKLLDGLKVGDKVRFKAAHEGGQFVVTAIEPRR
ncbi:copper-binding protein [Roseateles asaccharophilus]|uniref:Cu/Ag efflux protein CusF n=1 Tax=Roseateles asaccharophilus TaxID=582607 RepID=A0ABU2AAX2_9BURK|nr:copper-binding protein [Roseateles asaccharophilus]MDR7334270.1 Cu/Ag efflux protein CusF [Roseateles asaccharophilus]